MYRGAQSGPLRCKNHDSDRDPVRGPQQLEYVECNRTPARAHHLQDAGEGGGEKPMVVYVCGKCFSRCAKIQDSC